MVPRPSSGEQFRRLLAVASLAVALAVAFGGMVWVQTSGAGADHVYFAVGAAIVTLALSAILLHAAFFPGKAATISFAAALGIVLAGWTWQRAAFSLLISHGSPEAGYMAGEAVTPAGIHARHLVLDLPAVTVTVLLILLLLFGIASAWRHKARWSVCLMVLWWLVLTAVFELPSLYWILRK